MGWIGLVGAEIFDSKGKPFGTIERFVNLTGGNVILEVKLSEKSNGIDRIQIPLEECILKGDSVSTKKSIKSILNAEKKKKKDELKDEHERFKKMLEKRRRLSEPESVTSAVDNESLISEVKSVIKDNDGPSTPADWIICPNCDSALKELFKFCPYCSEPLPYCPKCGKPVKKDFQACPWCGNKL
jgi:RNA polymerase subunit RPABC4/transcription elongation factor Spt4